MRIGKKFARRRNDSAKPRCSEPRTGFTDARGAARFRAKSRGFGKSIPLTYEEGIDRRVSSGFWENRILRQTAKQVFGNRNPLRCFHHEKTGGFYEHRLAEEYDWSDSVSNLSAKLQRESIRYKEVVELADVLDCDILWVKRGDRR